MQADDLRLLGIPRLRRIIAIVYPKHDTILKDFPDFTVKVENLLNVSV